MQSQSERKLAGLSVVLPAYNDAKSLPMLLKKCVKVLPTVAKTYEIIVVNDASEDNTKEVLMKLQHSIPILKIITHKENRGYGGALISGFKNARGDFVFYTDGDGQYDVLELKKLVAELDGETDVVTGFKAYRKDPWYRKVIGTLYNQTAKLFFGLRVRDIDCDFRLIRRSMLTSLGLTVKSGAFDVELIKKLQENHARIKEVPVHHYKRQYGNSQFFSLKRIIKSLYDVVKLTTAPGYDKNNSAY